jgi:hypothetical protein
MINNLPSKIFGFILTSAISFILVFTLFNRNQVIAKEDEQLININYETVYVNNKKLPSNISKTIKEGNDGLAYVSDDSKDIIVEMNPEIIERGTGEQGIYYGYLTGYGADCEGCTGVYYCKTREGKWLNIYRDGIYYNDIEYGSVRVLAAAVVQFPCGTIMTVEDKKHEKFTGIVLDTGSAMRAAYRKGKVHIDVAHELETSAGIGTYTDFSGTVKFEVQRWGW